MSQTIETIIALKKATLDVTQIFIDLGMTIDDAQEHILECVEDILVNARSNGIIFPTDEEGPTM